MIEQVYLDTYAVLHLQPDFAQSPRMGAAREIDVAKLSTARRYSQTRGVDVKHTLTFDWQLQGEDEIRYLSEFFYHHKGKWQPFFVPSWHKELELAETAQTGSDRVFIEPVNYGAVYFRDGGHALQLGHYVFLLHEDGTMHFSRVLGVVGWPPESAGSESDSTASDSGSFASTPNTPEELILETPLAHDFEPSRTVMGFCYFVRSMQDDLELEYSGPDMVRAKITYQELAPGAWLPSDVNEFELELDLEYTDCQDIVSVSWEYAEGDVVQTAWRATGPWYEYIAFEETPELVAGKATVRINNAFNGERWFRVVDSTGSRRTKSKRALASLVTPPVLEISGTTASTRGLRQAPLGIGYEDADLSEEPPIPAPYSVVENGYISPTNVYVEPVARLLYYKPVNGGETTIATVVSEHPGGFTRFTRDGSDPTPTTANPRFQKLDDNVYASGNDFALKVNARCFFGDCQSPLVTILVDKQYLMTQYLKTWVSSGQAGAYCYEDYVDDDGHLWKAGLSCSVIYPSSGVMVDVVKDTACIGPSILGSGTTQDRAIYSYTFNVAFNRKLYLPFHFATVAHAYNWRFGHCSIYRHYQWDSRFFRCFEYLDFFSQNGEGICKVGESEYYKKLGGFAGPDGTIDAFKEYTDDLCRSLSLLSCPQCAGKRVVGRWDIVSSLHDDETETVFPDQPPPVDPPEPPEPEPTELFYDLFETYSDGDVAEQVLNEGQGWEDEWFFQSASEQAGYEFWDGNVDGELPDSDEELDEFETEAGQDLNGGEGWDGDWKLYTDKATFGWEYWEDYTDGDVADKEEFLNKGFGWAVDPELEEIVLPGDSAMEWWYFYTAPESEGLTFEGNTVGVYNDGSFPVADTNDVIGSDVLTTVYPGLGDPVGDTFADYSDGVYAGGAPGGSVTRFTSIIVG